MQSRMQPCVNRLQRLQLYVSQVMLSWTDYAAFCELLHARATESGGAA